MILKVKLGRVLEEDLPVIKTIVWEDVMVSRGDMEGDEEIIKGIWMTIYIESRESLHGHNGGKGVKLLTPGFLLGMVDVERVEQMDIPFAEIVPGADYYCVGLRSCGEPDRQGMVQ